MNFQLAVLMIYSALFIGFGLFISRRVRTADDFLVASRSLGPGLLATTFLAANIGAGSTVGAAGLGYAFGLGAWWWVGSAGIGSLVLANTVGPKIWALAAKHRWRTVGDYLEHRYNRTVRVLIASLLWVGTLMILAGQLIAISQILEVIAGLPKWKGCIIGGVVVTSYFAAGGLLASAWVNLIQLGVMFTGFLLAVPLALRAIGGWSALEPSLSGSAELGVPGILSYVAILVPSFIISPGLIQKLYGARDERAVRAGVNWNAAGLLVFAFAPPILGIIAHAHYPNLPNRELALPTVMTKLMPGWFGLLALAAVFSAEISTCDAILFMLSSSLSIDLYKKFLRPAATERDVLLAGRLAAMLGAFLGVLLAVELPSIISALQIFYTLMAVALFAPLLAGLYSPKPAAGRAVAAIVTSIAITAAAHFLTGGTGIWIFPPSLIGILAGFMIMITA
ncbi:MAG: sodium:solute symporter [Acidobacteria bacterium]|nr:MAG: sodium:solute symporter [Acidobacteriota bacterium]